jgi:cell division transport system permease protein
LSALAERGYALRHAADLARQRPARVLLVALLTALTLATPLLAAALTEAAQDWIAQTRAGPEVSLFVKPGTAARELEALRTRLSALDGVATVRLVPREQAFAELAKRTGVSVGEGRANPLPDVLVARFPFGARTEQIERIAIDARGWPGIDAVRADNDGYQRVLAVAGPLREAAVGAGLVALGALLLAQALALMQLVAPERDEARLLALVGARPGFIVRGYAYLAAATTAIGALLGVAGAHAALAWAVPRLAMAAMALGPAPVWPAFPLPAAAITVAAAALLGGLTGALMCRIGLGRVR